MAKVALGEGDAGIAYASDGAGARGEGILVIPLPEEVGHRGECLIAVTERAEEPGIGAEFLAMCGSGEGAAILRKRGLLTPAPGSP